MDLLPPLHLLARNKTMGLKQSTYRLDPFPPPPYNALVPFLFVFQKKCSWVQLGIAWGGVEWIEIRRTSFIHWSQVAQILMWTLSFTIYIIFAKLFQVPKLLFPYITNVIGNYSPFFIDIIILMIKRDNLCESLSMVPIKGYKCGK